MTKAEAIRIDQQHVAFAVHNDCEKIADWGRKLAEARAIDAYQEVSPAAESVVMRTVRKTLPGCCAGCAVPVGLFKAMQVVAGLALPKDISSHQSKSVTDLMAVPFNCLVTVCGHTNETCPMFPGKAKVVHVGFDDPPALAKTATTEREALDCSGRVRDEIRAYVETLPQSLEKKGGERHGYRSRHRQ